MAIADPGDCLATLVAHVDAVGAAPVQPPGCRDLDSLKERVDVAFERVGISRRGGAGQNYALKLTAAGLKAIAVDDGLESAAAPKEGSQVRRKLDVTKASDPDGVDECAKALTPRAGSKLARVIDLLRRSEGANILDLTGATGWLPHTTRAALTRLRKRGYAVARERVCDEPFGG